MANANGLLTNLGGDARVLCRRTWWVFLVGGIALVIFGVLAFINPGIALLVLAMFFAASVLVDGAFNAIGAVQHRGKDGWWLMLLLGILGIVIGAYALVKPPISMLALIYLVALQAIFAGVLLIGLGYKVRKATEREWILYLTGALSVLLGILIVVNPGAGGVAIVYTIAAWAIIVGALKIWFSFKVKSLPEKLAVAR